MERNDDVCEICGVESTVGVHGVVNRQVVSAYYCDAHARLTRGKNGLKEKVTPTAPEVDQVLAKPDLDQGLSVSDVPVSSDQEVLPLSPEPGQDDHAGVAIDHAKETRASSPVQSLSSDGF